jgi:ADP-dependent NAD(P)H-hydrate dehydratase / NAD(P)H-hydrate epimerase
VVGFDVTSNETRLKAMKESLLTAGTMSKLIPKRPKDSFKSNYGHILVLAGSPGLTGAAALTCQAAMRAGAGLVTLGIPQSLNHILEIKLTEVMTLPLVQTEEGCLAEKAADRIFKFIEGKKVSALVIGPGLSTSTGTARLVKRIIGNIQLPCVLDADGINIFQENSGTKGLRWKVDEIKESKARLILTPHPGELGRLINEMPRNIQRDRVKYAVNTARENGVIVVLKGYRSVITDGTKVFINPTGNPGMATAGCGDVLTGLIGSLISQLKDKNLLDAARLGVYLHGLAGDLAAGDKTEMSLIAGDIVENITKAIKKLGGR